MGETTRTRDPGTLQQLAERLFLSRHTVGYHLHKIYAKLNITSRAELGQLDLGSDDPTR